MPALAPNWRYGVACPACRSRTYRLTFTRSCDSEPLPPASPLWKMPQVFMAPHVGGLFEEYAQMAIPLIIRNVRAFLAGQSDQMINRIDRSRPATAETKP